MEMKQALYYIATYCPLITKTKLKQDVVTNYIYIYIYISLVKFDVW